MSVTSTVIKYHAPDGGWGWVVVLSSFVLQGLTSGSTYTFGIMYVELLAYFQASRSATAWIGSIQPCLLYMTGIIGAPLIKRFSWRSVSIAGCIISAIGFGTSALVQNMYLLYFSYGVLTGFGNGLMYVTSMVAVQHYFDSKRSLATGLAVSGSGVGTFVFGFLLQMLINMYGWRWTMVIEGTMFLLGIVFCALIRPLSPIKECESNRDDEKSAILRSRKQSSTSSSRVDLRTMSLTSEQSLEGTQNPRCCESKCCSTRCEDLKTILIEIFDFSLFRKPLFTLFCFSVLMFTFGYHVPYTYTPDRAFYIGVHRNSASFLVSIIGISNVASRLMFGWISDRIPPIRLWMAAAMLTLAGAISCLIFLFNTHLLLIIYSILFGIFSGCFSSLLPVVLVDLLGVENIDRSIALALAVRAFGFLFASPLSGWIIDITGSFDAPFYVVGGMETLGGFVYFSIACITSCPRKKDYQHVKEEFHVNHAIHKNGDTNIGGIKGPLMDTLKHKGAIDVQDYQSLGIHPHLTDIKQ